MLETKNKLSTGTVSANTTFRDNLFVL